MKQVEVIKAEIIESIYWISYINNLIVVNMEIFNNDIFEVKYFSAFFINLPPFVCFAYNCQSSQKENFIISVNCCLVVQIEHRPKEKVGGKSAGECRNVKGISPLFLPPPFFVTHQRQIAKRAGEKWTGKTSSDRHSSLSLFHLFFFPPLCWGQKLEVNVEKWMATWANRWIICGKCCTATPTFTPQISESNTRTHPIKMPKCGADLPPTMQKIKKQQKSDQQEQI